jgi:hypothetical protein
MLQRYLEDKETDASLNVGADMRKINFCFKYLKDIYLQAVKSKQSSSPQSSSSSTAHQSNTVTIVDASHYDSKEMKDLKETLRQRDNEISNKPSGIVYFRKNRLYWDVIYLMFFCVLS